VRLHLFAQSNLYAHAWQLGVFLLVTMWHAHRYVFSPMPAGDDAAVIGILLQNALTDGRFAFSLFADQGTLVTYPMGAVSVAWSLASPLHDGSMVMHAFPAFATSVLIFFLADLTDAPFLLAAGLRLSLLAFDVPFVHIGLDQTTKVMVGFALAAGAWLVARSRTVLGAGLGYFAIGLQTLVNFANTYVSLSVAVVLLLWKSKQWRGALVAVALGLFAIAQEPYVIERVQTQACRLYRHEAFCTAPDAALQTSKKSGALVFPKLSDAFPHFISNPARLLWPDDDGVPAMPSKAAFVLLVIAAIFVVGVHLGHVRLVLMLTVFFAALVSVLAVAQVAVFYKTTPELRFMLQYYTEICLRNVWQPAAAVIVLLAAAGARRRPVVLSTIVLAVLVDIEVHMLPSSGHIDTPSMSWKEIATKTLAVERVAPHRLMHTGAAHIFDHEEWVLPDRASQALENQLGYPLHFGYNFRGAWPSSAVSIARFYERLCGHDCALLKEQKVEGVVTVHGSQALCGARAASFLAASPCFTSDDGTVWRVR